jgi:tRNA threonylcarbamoyladenosine biosynthesis protein TsaB
LRILALDTATRATVAALCDLPGTDLELERRDDPVAGARPGHARRLLELTVELLEQSGGGWELVERIAVGTGPGTFTGLRIGIATARGLARAREIPLVGVSTLESLALGAQAAAAEMELDRVYAVLDARRGEVFAASWEREDGDPAAARQLSAPVAIAPERLAAELAELGRSVLAIGDGAIEFRQALERSGAVVPEDGSGLHRVSAINHCRLAVSAAVPAPVDVRPAYLRLPDAEIARRAQANS